MYIMNCTRLDIAYSIKKVSRFPSNLSMEHWKKLKGLLIFEVHREL